MAALVIQDQYRKTLMMRKPARFLLVLTTLLWVVGILPAARACVASGMDASCCLVDTPDCHMACCKQPVGNLQNGDLPAVARTLEMPAQPLALRVAVLSN